MKKVTFVMGTRPEAIKLCPLILKMKKNENFIVNVCITGQHRSMLDQVLETFEVNPDTNFNLMEPDQTLPSLTAKTIRILGQYFYENRTDLVIVQGDTTTAFCGALASFYNKITVCHIEAGLRTGIKYSPFPEEINRKLISQIADYHFTPTTVSFNNLILEGIPSDRIFTTGNTVIDSLLLAVKKIEYNLPLIPGLPGELLSSANEHPIVLITGHRRENFGDAFKRICNSILELSKSFPNVHFIYPVHLNPNVRGPVYEILSGQKNIHLLEPLEYLPFVALLIHCKIILTDSGGIQEEAPSLGKPVLVMRDTTERPEAVDAGTVKLVGTSQESIVSNVSELLTDSKKYSAMSNKINPYGDGNACERIITILMDKLCY